MLLPALNRAKVRAQGIQCMNNTKQLTIGWIMYAQDNSDHLVNNYGAAQIIAGGNSWINNVMTWTLSTDNTNTALVAKALLGQYLSQSVATYRCPADHVLTQAQAAAGWAGRIRSYSLNGMVGDLGWNSPNGINPTNPNYRQYFKLSYIQNTSRIFVFLAEHPDSIDDGLMICFAIGTPTWINIPASYHDRADSLSFADGHSELHKWRSNSTKFPPSPHGIKRPANVPANDQADYNWLVEGMSEAK